MTHTYTIVIVDDQADIRSALRRALQSAGHTIVEFEDAESALSYLQSADADIVVSDYEMPGIGGLDFLNQVRIFWPQSLRILLTGKADVQLAVRALNEGAAHRFLLKPWNKLSLLGTLDLAMRAHRPSDAVSH